MARGPTRISRRNLVTERGKLVVIQRTVQLSSGAGDQLYRRGEDQQETKRDSIMDHPWVLPTGGNASPLMIPARLPTDVSASKGYNNLSNSQLQIWACMDGVDKYRGSCSSMSSGRNAAIDFQVRNHHGKHTHGNTIRRNA